MSKQSKYEFRFFFLFSLSFSKRLSFFIISWVKQKSIILKSLGVNKNLCLEDSRDDAILLKSGTYFPCKQAEDNSDMAWLLLQEY